MRKSNEQIELECSENWLLNYREQGMTDWRVAAMERHVADLRSRLA